MSIFPFDVVAGIPSVLEGGVHTQLRDPRTLESFTGVRVLEDRIEIRFSDIPSLKSKAMPVVASGDRHVGGIYRTDSIIEITSSSLTHTMQYVKEPDDLRIGGLVEVNNFGGIVFDWKSKMVIVNLMETDGKHAGKIIRSINASFQ